MDPDADFDMMDSADNVGGLFRFIAIYQQKEFVGQKAINQGIQEEVETWLKREILVDGDKFSYAKNESPVRAAIHR